MKKEILEALNWRYATKKFDTKKISEEDLNVLKESLHLAPSSFGLQPWRFIHVTSKDLREKIKGAAFGQSQVVDASDLFVLAAKRDLTENDIEHFVQSISKTRNIPAESLNGYKEMMLGHQKAMTHEQRAIWNQKQVYIALGFLLSSAAQMKIDACPMEGFSHADVDKILNLEKDGLTSVVLCPVGYRAHDDTTSSYKKVRYPKDMIFIKK